LRQLSLRQFLDKLHQPRVIEIAVAMPFMASLWSPAGLRQLAVGFAGEAEIEGALNWIVSGVFRIWRMTSMSFR